MGYCLGIVLGEIARPSGARTPCTTRRAANCGRSCPITGDNAAGRVAEERSRPTSFRARRPPVNMPR